MQMLLLFIQKLCIYYSKLLLSDKPEYYDYKLEGLKRT